jgi:hypothetical protein
MVYFSGGGSGGVRGGVSEGVGERWVVVGGVVHRFGSHSCGFLGMPKQYTHHPPPLYT